LTELVNCRFIRLSLCFSYGFRYPSGQVHLFLIERFVHNAFFSGDAL